MKSSSCSCTNVYISRCTAPLTLNLNPVWSWVVNITPWCTYLWKRTLVPTWQEAGGKVWTFWKREKSLVPSRNQTPDCPVNSLVTILTTLTRLPTFLYKIKIFSIPKSYNVQQMYLCNPRTVTSFILLNLYAITQFNALARINSFNN
jgi:hypothetical protein